MDTFYSLTEMLYHKKHSSETENIRTKIGKMLTIAVSDGQNTASGEKTDKHFTGVVPSSATHSKVFAIKSDSSPLSGTAEITLK